MKSHSVSGPIGCPQPSFMPASMSSRVAKPSSSILTAAIRYGISSMLTMKPERSLVEIGVLPSDLTNSVARSIVSSPVGSALTRALDTLARPLSRLLAGGQRADHLDQTHHRHR